MVKTPAFTQTTMAHAARLSFHHRRGPAALGGQHRQHLPHRLGVGLGVRKGVCTSPAASYEGAAAESNELTEQGKLGLGTPSL